MFSLLPAFILVLFAGIQFTAMSSDIRRFTIPNRLCLSLVLLWPAWLMTGAGLADILPAVAIAVFSFLVGALLFARGVVGGGDVKLFAASMLWAGPAHARDFLYLTALLGGVLSAVLLTRHGQLAFARVQEVTLPGEGFKRPIPYGVAIAIAAIATLLLTLSGH